MNGDVRDGWGSEFGGRKIGEGCGGSMKWEYKVYKELGGLGGLGV